MVYNNGGYIAQTQNEQYFAVWDDIEPADTLQTFQKPPGQLSNIIIRFVCIFCTIFCRHCSQLRCKPPPHVCRPCCGRCPVQYRCQ